MRYRLLLALLVAVFVLGSTPVSAEIVTVEIDDDTDMVNMEPLLPPEEVERIATLQGAGDAALLSAISPDGQTVFAVAATEDDTIPVMLNINDGSAVTIAGLGGIFPLTNLVWLSNEQLTGVGLSIFGLFSGNPFVRFTIVSTTGDVQIDELTGLDDLPISLAPNGTRLLVDTAFTLREEEEEVEVSIAATEAAILDRLQRNPGALSPFNLHVPVLPERERAPELARFAHLLALQDNRYTALQVSEDTVDLAILDLPTGQVTPLVSLSDQTFATAAPAWSPDSNQIAVTYTIFEQLQRGEVSLGTLITQDTLGNQPPAENPFFTGNVLDVFDVSTGEVARRTQRAADGNGDIYMSAHWAPDGQTLAVKMGRPAVLAGRTHPIYTFQFISEAYLRFYDRAGNQTGTFDTPQTSYPGSAVIFAGPDELLINTFDGASGAIYYHNRQTGLVQQLGPFPGFYRQVQVTNNVQRQMVFVFDSLLIMPEIYRMGWDGQNIAALTTINAERNAANAVQANPVSFTLANGQVRQGYLVQPAGNPFPPQNEPVVVWQEGGPGVPMLNRYGANVENPYNLLPNFGINVLVMPFSGRPGQGGAFFDALADGDNFGAIDVDEAAEVVRQMIDLGWTSNGQVGVTGCSYGGYFTAQSIARHPGLYAAANPQCGLYDNFTEWQTGFQGLISYLQGAPPLDAPLEYALDSPGYIGGQVTDTATLIFHGTDDFLAINIAETYHEVIRQTGSPVLMLRYQDEGHGLGERASQLYAAQAQIAWFRQYLQPAGEEPPQPVGTAVREPLP